MKLIFSERNEKTKRVVKYMLYTNASAVRKQKKMLHMYRVSSEQNFYQVPVLFDNEELILNAVNE